MLMQYVKLAAIILLAIVAIVLIVKLIKTLLANRKRKAEMREAADKHQREESLDQLILNANYHADIKKMSNPYDVSYSQAVQDQHLTIGEGLMVSLEEKNSLSEKKYVLGTKKLIRIGSGIKENDIIIQEKGAALIQCEIFASGEKIFIRNRGTAINTILQRKKERAIVDERGLRLLTGDMIHIGSVEYKVTILGER